MNAFEFYELMSLNECSADSREFGELNLISAEYVKEFARGNDVFISDEIANKIAECHNNCQKQNYEDGKFSYNFDIYVRFELQEIEL